MPPGPVGGRRPSTVTSGPTGRARSGRKMYSLEGVSQRTRKTAASRATPAPTSRPGEAMRRTSEDAADQAAVHGYRRPADVRAAVGGEEADDVGDLARRAEAAQGDLGEVGLGRPGRIDLAQPLGVDPPGRDRVDGDPVRAELARE